MSVQNEKTENKKNAGEVFYNWLLEASRAPESHIKDTEKTVGEVMEEMKKDMTYWEVDFDDPVFGAYYTVVQNRNMDEEAKALSKIINSIDELAEDELKNSQHLFIYRLYELSCNDQVDIGKISAGQIKP